jgi:hypothetical protein
LKNEGIGHGHEQKDDGQQHKDLQFPGLVADKGDKNQGQTGVLALFDTELFDVKFHISKPLKREPENIFMNRTVD